MDEVAERFPGSRLQLEGLCLSEAALLQYLVRAQPAFHSRATHAKHFPSTDQNPAGEGCIASLKYIVVSVRQGSRGTAS